MIEILFWVSIISGGILVLLLLLSILGGLEIDIDADFGDADSDSSSGGMGLIKGVLTFVSVSAWMIRVMMIGNQQKWIAIAIGLISGLTAYFILSYVLKFSFVMSQMSIGLSMMHYFKKEKYTLEYLLKAKE